MFISLIIFGILYLKLKEVDHELRMIKLKLKVVHNDILKKNKKIIKEDEEDEEYESIFKLNKYLTMLINIVKDKKE